MDDEDHKLKPAYLLGRIEALQHIIECVARELPERAMHHVSHFALDYQRDVDREARSRDTNEWKDRASGVYDTCVEVANTIDARLGDHHSGGALRTIQPAPIPKEQQIYPDLDW